MSGHTFRGALVDCTPGQQPSENDARELETFRRFLLDVGAHRATERALRRRLPLRTPNVPEEWWDPDGSRRALDASEADATTSGADQ